MFEGLFQPMHMIMILLIVLIIFGPGKLPELGAAVEERRLPVRYQDIDGVMHVNNTSVLAWALEAAPEETWRSRRLAALEALYLAECRPGGAVLSRAASSGDGVLLHSVVREEDGRELARFRTAWEGTSGRRLSRRRTPSRRTRGSSWSSPSSSCRPSAAEPTSRSTPTSSPTTSTGFARISASAAGCSTSSKTSPSTTTDLPPHAGRRLPQ